MSEIKESDLPLSGQIKSIRAIDNVGASILSSPEQLHTVLNIDAKADKVYVDANLETKADKIVTDNAIAEVNANLATKASSSDLTTHISAVNTSIAEVNANLATKASSNDVTTQISAVNTSIAEVNANLATKASTSDVTTQISALSTSVAAKADVSYVDDAVSIINTSAIDAFSMVNLYKADLTYVNQLAATKAPAMDYSLLTEQIVPGEFFVDRNGIRKQVYGKRLSLSGVLVPHQFGGQMNWMGLISGVSAVVSSHGFLCVPKNTDAQDPNAAYNFIELLPSVVQNGGFEMTTMVSNDSPYWGNNTLSTRIIVKSPNIEGRIIRIEAFFKYTKL